MVTYKAMFAYAVSRRLMDHNPAGDSMKKPAADLSMDRLPYDDDDQGFIFTRPLFTGSAGNPLVGYREKPGDQIVRDAKYFIPICALLTGMRLEEMASLRLDEVKVIDGVTVMDLTGRPKKGESSLKNESSRRIIPISKSLEATGFLT